MSLLVSPALPLGGGGGDQVGSLVLCLARQEHSWLLELLSAPPCTTATGLCMYSISFTYIGLLGAYCIQWNPSNLDTLGAEDSVLISEVSGVQEWYILLAVRKSVLF